MEHMTHYSSLHQRVAAAITCLSRVAVNAPAPRNPVPRQSRLTAVALTVAVCLAAQLSSTIISRATAAVPTTKVRMYFNMGPVEIELYGNESPLNVANFLSYVDAGSYNDSFIHRTRASNPSQPYGFDLFAQGGSFKYPINSFIDSNPITPGSAVVNEFDAGNGLTNKPGSLAAARSTNPDSATSGWFINQSNNSASFDPGPYTVLGQVTSGMSVIDQIPFLPNSSGLSGSAFASTPFYGNDLVVIERVARIPILAGDYDFSGIVNNADYAVWRGASVRALMRPPTATATVLSMPPTTRSGENRLVIQRRRVAVRALQTVAAPEPNSLLLAAMVGGVALAFRGILWDDPRFRRRLARDKFHR